jgi:phage terminase large subunit-like protein
MDMLAWDRCGADVEIEDYKGWPCVFGLDLASKTDFAALSMLFHQDGKYVLFCRLWIPDAQITESDNSQYSGWEQNGHIVATDGNVLDHDRVKFEIKELAEEYKPSAIAYDPGFDRVIPQSLLNEGLPMIEVRSTAANFSEAMKSFEAWALGGKIRHDRNPAYTWMLSNVKAHINRGEQFYPTKERFDQKIDGPVSTLLAVSTMGQEKTSIWETRGAPE